MYTKLLTLCILYKSHLQNIHVPNLCIYLTLMNYIYFYFLSVTVPRILFENSSVSISDNIEATIGFASFVRTCLKSDETKDCSNKIGM